MKSNLQEKRKDQKKFSEDMVVYSILGILFIIVLMKTIQLLNYV